MISAYFASMVAMPVIVVGPGRYVTRCGDIVTITEASDSHDFGCVGSYLYQASGRSSDDYWHKSGRLYGGMESASDIIGVAP